MKDMREKLVALISAYTEYVSAKELHSAEFDERFTDYLLANGVIVPPCKVGDMVYCYCGDFGVVLPYFVVNMTIGFVGKDRDYIAFEANCHAEETDELLDGIDFEIDDIGKTVFLTPEEAEVALEERR